MGFVSAIRIFPTTFYLPGARFKYFLTSMFSFYLLHVCWKITLSKQFLYFRKLFAKATRSVSFCCALSMFFILLLTSALKKYHLYIHFYIIGSVLHQPMHVTFSTRPSFAYIFRIFSLSTHFFTRLAFLPTGGKSANQIIGSIWKVN